MASHDLLPCPIPWCRGEARMDSGYPDMRERFIICTKCSLKTPHSKPFDEAGVTALWNNTRAAETELREALQKCFDVAERAPVGKVIAKVLHVTRAALSNTGASAMGRDS